MMQFSGNINARDSLKGMYCRGDAQLYEKSNDLKVKRIVINNINVVKAYGECDICSAHLLKDAMAEIISEGSKKLIVDVKDLLYVDNSGIAAVLWARHKIEEVGGRMVVIGFNSKHSSLCNLFDGVVCVASTIKEAISALSLVANPSKNGALKG